MKEGDLDAMLSQVDSMSDIEYQKLLTQADEMDKDFEKMSRHSPIRFGRVSCKGYLKKLKARFIDELEEQQCHLCGDESFDAGWKAGLEKAIDTIKEMSMRLKFC